MRRLRERKGVAAVSARECEVLLELALLKMKKCKTANQCRGQVTEILALVKEKKFERLKEELGVLG